MEEGNDVIIIVSKIGDIILKKQTPKNKQIHTHIHNQKTKIKTNKKT